MPTKRLCSSPPRLPCRSPGPGPSVSSLSRPKPHLSWVMKLTLAHTTALTASHTPVSATDTAGTHSHFTHAQAQPHQSTALLRMGKCYHFETLEASGSPLHSAPLQRSRLSPRTTARRRQALTPVWSTCCGHSRPSHAARAGGAACRGSASDEFILPAVPDAARTAVVDRRQLTGKMKSTALAIGRCPEPPRRGAQ